MLPKWAREQDRISILARPKIIHQTVFCRPSVYWVDKIPKAQPRTTIPVLTPRQEMLSRSKTVNADFSGDRPSAVWPVKAAALKVKASSRLLELAQPRPYRSAWEINRPPYPLVSKGALAAVPSQRIIALAVPRTVPASVAKKPHRKLIHRPAGAAKYDELSKPKIYTFDKRDPLKVSKAALQYVPSPRIIEISRPVRIRGKVA
ncbi:sperm microtubule associated protein 2 [Zootoca vivipara]|uniref:sperm microtubule associated protein 2 n=1 Tax=Zootoca vivipara TaxID=8524 RepID=UPI001590B331|nr:sperm microtubule associated protein 2 [Zootoca vivipara]